jgi:hypothetical protein
MFFTNVCVEIVPSRLWRFCSCLSQDWKPAGTDSDYRQVAACLVLEHLRADGFIGVGNAWMGCLFQRGRVYVRTSDQTYFLSFGFHGWSALGWKLTSVGAKVLVATMHGVADKATVKTNLQPMIETGLDEADRHFLGVPFRKCDLLLQIALWLVSFSMMTLL